jgi:hypothetical protein
MYVYTEEITMKRLMLLVLLMSASFVIGQTSGQTPSNNQSGPIKVHGCVSRASGDYILIKTDPGDTYRLLSSKGVKLHSYLGQRVEITGTQAPTMATTSDEGHTVSPVTITVSSVKTLSKECRD